MRGGIGEEKKKVITLACGKEESRKAMLFWEETESPDFTDINFLCRFPSWVFVVSCER